MAHAEAMDSMTPDQEALRAAAVDFIKAEFPSDPKPGWARSFLPKAARAHFVGDGGPKSLGGQGRDLLTAELGIEAIGATDWFAAGMVTYLNSLVIFPLVLGGSDSQHKKWLTPILGGRFLSACALTEPNAGSHDTALETSAELHGDEWVINGHKIFITSADEADYLRRLCANRPSPRLAARRGHQRAVRGDRPAGVPSDKTYGDHGAGGFTQM
jgi:alkylation response protein AidB-like acyl-CoA dehydrogenase